MLVSVLRFTDSDYTCVWLAPLVLLAMLVSVLRFTDSDYTCVWLPLWLCWLCWCLSFDLRILITLVSGYPSGSFDYVGVCPSIYGFWLHLCLITSGSFGYVGVCPSIYGFWLHLCLITSLVILAMLVSVLRFTDSDYTCVWLPLVLLTMLVSVLRFTDSDYTCVWLPLWFFWLCWCLSSHLRILITLVSDYLSGSFGYDGVCPSIYGFWLHLCLITSGSFTMLVSVLRFTDSDYTCVWLPLWFCWLCWCLSFDLRILITLVSDYLSGSFDYAGVCPSIYGF